MREIKNKEEYIKSTYSDYLLIKDLPGYKSGCIFTCGEDYLYYISFNPEENAQPYLSKQNICRYPLIRFNIHQIVSNPEWFREIDKQENRDMKIKELISDKKL